MTASLTLNNQLRFQGQRRLRHGGHHRGRGAEYRPGSPSDLHLRHGGLRRRRGHHREPVCGLLPAAPGLPPGRQPAHPPLPLPPHPSLPLPHRPGRPPLPGPPDPELRGRHRPQPRRRSLRGRRHRRHDGGEPGHDDGQLRHDRLRPRLPAGLRLQLRRRSLAPGPPGLRLLREGQQRLPPAALGPGLRLRPPDRGPLPQRPGGHRLRLPGPAAPVRHLRLPGLDHPQQHAPPGHRPDGARHLPGRGPAGHLPHPAAADPAGAVPGPGRPDGSAHRGPPDPLLAPSRSSSGSSAASGRSLPFPKRPEARSGAGKAGETAPVAPPRLRSFLHGNVQKAPEWSHHSGAFFLLFRVIFPDFRGNSPIGQNRSKPASAETG